MLLGQCVIGAGTGAGQGRVAVIAVILLQNKSLNIADIAFG